MSTLTEGEPIAKPITGRHRFEKAWYALWPILFVLHVQPVRATIFRELMILLVLVLWLGGTVLFWRQKWARLVGIAVALAVLLVALLPGQQPKPESLRDEYLRSLRSYNGINYVWGGEAPTGIDCSGLIRASMVDALLRRGLLSGNPQLLRDGIALWWRDSSAKEMGQGYGGRMALVTETRSINQLDHSLLLPGDLSVTNSGEHVMAYLGEHRWIEADPGPMSVIVETAPGSLHWFNIGMRIMRWKLLTTSQAE